MSWLAIIFLVGYAAGLASLAVSVRQAYGMVEHQRAAAPPESARASPGTLDVIVPVKDEAGHIAHCIGSVLAQDYPGFRLIVVNDRSSDGTGEVISEIAARDSRVSRFDIRELPEGMYGKPHALSEVSGQLRADFIAFVDSDLFLDRRCLRTLAHHLESGRFDWVATMGAPDLRGFWERLLIPLLGAVTFAWYDPRKISDPNWPDAIGSGLMLCRRSAYEAIGGHGAVARIYDEDSELIRIAKRAGQRVSFVMTPELFTQRHYGTLGRTIHGITRTLVGGVKTLRRLLITMNAFGFVSLFPIGVLVVVGASAAMGRRFEWSGLWAGMAAFHLVLALGLARRVFHTAGVPWGYMLLHPLGAVMMMYLCGRAAIHLEQGKPIVWRGTAYKEQS